ncbi:MAG: cell division protein FtsQ/DivIB [Burkholderiales bacterium]|nr:cell division protein FtsQ/DivIB [Burkholderiales bacterium]
MWDDAEALNAASNALYALGAFLLAYAIFSGMAQLPVFALHEIRLTGNLTHVSPQRAEDIAKRELRGNFFTVDLGAAREAFEQLPWVRRAEVRRQWPDRLVVKLEEQVALARWNGRDDSEEALVNVHGEVFAGAVNAAGAMGAADAEDAELPVFSGPPGSAAEIAQRYAAFRQQLAAIGQAPARIEISPRGAWIIRLASGLLLQLGRTEIESRLARFVASYDESIGRFVRQLDYVDLRYANGFAVHLRNES